MRHYARTEIAWKRIYANEATYLSCGDGADATEARADSPGREKLLLFCCCWYCSCRRALDDCVEVEEGREMSCPSGGSGEGALSSAEGAVAKIGRSRACAGDGNRRVGSMGEARYINGANVEAVLAVAGVGQLEEAIPPLEWYS